MAIRSLCSWLVIAALCTAGSPTSASAAPGRSKARPKPLVEAPRVTAVVSATHPLVAQESMAAGSVLRVTGVGFGEAADTHATLKAAGVDDGVNLTVVSWTDNEIMIQLPSIAQLGIDAATASALEGEVGAEKPLVSMRVSIALLRGSATVADPIALRIALAAFDFDKDGVSRAQDSNDLDPNAH